MKFLLIMTMSFASAVSFAEVDSSSSKNKLSQLIELNSCSIKVMKKPIVFASGEYTTKVGKMFISFNSRTSNIDLKEIRQIKVGKTMKISSEPFDIRFPHILFVANKDIEFVALDYDVESEKPLPNISSLTANKIEELTQGNLQLVCAGKKIIKQLNQ
ncbi:MAG: hypothetical protein ACOYL6_08520 [Bacteriovoracaceae bacterium]